MALTVENSFPDIEEERKMFFQWLMDTFGNVRAASSGIGGLKYYVTLEGLNTFVLWLDFETPLTLRDKIHELVEFNRARGQEIKIIWPDVWLRRRSVIKSMLLNIAKENEKINARELSVRPVSTVIAEVFLNKYHLFGYCTAEHYIGLFRKSELLAICSFSAVKHFERDHGVHVSGELSRFCQKAGCTVIGGLSRIVAYYEANNDVNDIMTYVDREFGHGGAFKNLGFDFRSISHPLEFLIDKETMVRKKLSPKKINDLKFYRAFNIGNYKLVKDCGFIER